MEIPLYYFVYPVHDPRSDDRAVASLLRLFGGRGTHEIPFDFTLFYNQSLSYVLKAIQFVTGLTIAVVEMSKHQAHCEPSYETISWLRYARTHPQFILAAVT